MNLEKSVQELIAIGASVTANCHPCLRYHVDQAAAAGANTDAIRQAMEIGKMVARGAASETVKFLKTLTPDGPEVSEKAGDGCGCSPRGDSGKGE